jgi:shikimate dehydrogenase
LKEDIIPYLDQITPQAERIGAVNTVKVVDSILIGHNTDGEGFVQSLCTKGYSLNGKRVVILGAGGAAKAIAVTMVQQKCEILILNRNMDKAEHLAQNVVSLGGKAAGALLQKGHWLHEVDLLIQTTPIGMNGESYPFDLDGINSSAWVVDLIYHPAVTPFLEDAESQGCQTINGLEMLLYQGVLAWNFWLNIEAPVSVMRRALRQRSMGRSECIAE